jgi:aryl-alcohol dehydrogenase-like predicted oxidoreductase
MPEDRPLSRRDAIKLGLGAGALVSLNPLDALALVRRRPALAPLIERAIPSSGEKIPVVGIGTARSYERPAPADLPVLKAVLRQFPELGGKLLDTAPAYGRAEEVVGDALAELKNRDKYFLATKVSVGRGGGGDAAAAAAQMEASLRRLRTDRIDLMQIWNVSNPAVIVPVLDDWKAAKKIR